MADKASIVGTNDKGQFAVSAPRSSIDRVDVIDVDLVLHTKGGDRLILPGAALEAMTASPPTIQFSDGPMGADGLLSSVDKVLTPPTSIPAMTSLTEFDQKKTEGKKNRTADGKDQADEAAQQAQAQQVAPLPTEGQESSIDKLVAKAESMEADMRKKAFDPAPPKVYETPATTSDAPGSQPQTSKIPLYMTLSEGNVVGSQTVGAKVYGAGGPTGSSIADGILTGDAAQYGRETLSGSAGADIFYADAFAKTTGTWNATSASVLNETAYTSLDKETGLAPSGTAFYYAKEVALNVAGYIRRIDSVTITGLPTGISIQGATSMGGGKWSLASSDVVPTPSTLVLVYDVTTIHALFDKDSDGDGVNDYVDILMSVNVTGMGTTALNVTKTFVLRFQDADSSADITNNTPFYVTGTGSGWSDIYVMETASAPHTIVTFAGTYNDAQTLAQNAAATAATADGSNTVYAGNSNDTILAGAGNDTIYAYAGDDAISAGNGNNEVWAGNGNDTVISGTGNDLIYAGRGNNTITDGGGNNTVTVISTKTVDGTILSGNGKDVVTITGDGDNTITVGDEADSYTDGNDTVTTQNGTDIIHVGDGDNVVSTGNGDKTIYAGSGNDTITTTGGDGDDSIYAGDGNNWITAGNGANVITAGSGSDTVATGSGDDDIRIGAGANIVTDDGGSNFISTDADSGKDIISITVGTGTDSNTIWTGTEDNTDNDGNDTVTTSDSVDLIHVGDGDNLVTTGNGNKTIYAGAGNDTITTTGGDGDDSIYAGNGNNIITAGIGANVITAGSGNDTVTTGSGDDDIRIGAGANIVTDSGGTNFISTDAGSGKDVITITGDGDNTIWTGTEDSTNNDGNDTVTTQNGIDLIHVGDGDNLVTTGNGNKTIYAGTGNDTITTTGGNGDDSIYAGDGNNIVTAGAGNNVVTAGSGIDTVITGAGNDDISVGDGTRNIVWADDGTNVITAGSGDDTLIGGAGADSIVAGGGNDWIYGGTGANVTLDGGSGTDWLSFNGIGASVTAGTTTLSNWLTNAGTITGVTLGTALVSGVDTSGVGTLTHTGAGTETDAIGNIENFIGSQGDDILNLSGYTGASHTLYGLAGNDVLVGSALDDILYGGSGNDSLVGNAGNDIIFTSITSLQSTVTATALGSTGIDALADAATLSYTSAGLTGASTITTTGQHNMANGGAGADTIVGGAGNDYFVSTTGEYSDSATGAYDTFIGGTGFDTVDHSSFTSNLVIDLSNNLGRINGGAYIAEYSSIERILTGSGNDGITGTTNNEIFYAGNGSNSIWVGGGTDSAFGGTGNDYFYSAVGAAHTAYYDGGGGYNEYALRAGVETINGTSGSDRLFYNNSAATTLSSVTYGVFVNLDTSTNWVVTNTGALTTTAGTSYWYNWTSAGGTLWTTAMVGDTSASAGHGFYGDAAGDTYTGTIEQIYGSGYNDILIGNSANNWFFAAAGSDAIYGLAGADSIAMMYGGTVNSGADYIDGGNDVNGVADTYTLTANGNGTFSWAGGDLVSFLSGNNIDRALSINLDSSNHTDTVTTSAANAVNAGEISGWSSIVTVANVEHVYGGNYADFIYGSAAGNVIDGGAGNDTIYGYGGDDFIYAGSGADYIDGGTNTAVAGGGDWASYSGLTVSVEVYLADADLDGSGSNDQSAGGWSSYQARATGQNGYDYDTLIGIENVEGSSYADRIAGDGNANSLFGGVGNDTIYGGAGDDVINGGSDNDTIEGGSGSDSLNGGSGTDLLSYANSSLGVTVNLGANTATGGDATGDTISNFEYLRGSASDDSLTGSNGVNNIIYGGAGNDTIYGTTSVNASNYDTLYGDTGSDTISLTVAQLATTYVYGGSGNAAGNTTETGTDTLSISNNANLTSLNGSLIHSIEVINLANGSAQDVTAFSAQGNQTNVRTLINNILDNSGSTTLHLYLDNNDRFNTSYSGAGGAGSLVSNTNTQATYTYGGSNITVHWGSG